MEEITGDKNAILESRVNEMREKGPYVEICSVFQPLSYEKMQEFGKKVECEKGISFGKLLDEIVNYAKENRENMPIIKISGRQATDLDIMILLAFTREYIENEIIRLYTEINKED